jgi:hypothetical protein
MRTNLGYVCVIFRDTDRWLFRHKTRGDVLQTLAPETGLITCGSGTTPPEKYISHD